jgi:hypothetical protein
MSTSDRIRNVAPYVSRLLSDDYVQDQVREVVTDLRQGATRAKRKGVKDALGDNRVRRQFTAAAVAAGQVARILREPEPPKRHPIRRAVGMVAIAGAAAAIYINERSDQ